LILWKLERYIATKMDWLHLGKEVRNRVDKSVLVLYRRRNFL
jgi:hypothetical protein